MTGDRMTGDPMTGGPLPGAALRGLLAAVVGGGADRRRLEDAVLGFRAALIAQPDYRPALYGLAEALRRLGRIAEAEAVLRTGLERHPDAPELHLTLAETLSDWGRTDDAMTAAQTAAAYAPDDAGPATLIGRIAETMGQPDRAAGAYERALAAGAGDSMPARIALARLRRAAGDPEGALALLDGAAQACRTERERAFAETQRALALLAAGRLREGFRAYDARWKTGLLPPLDPGLPPWTGDPPAGRHLLIRAEQGLSECLQFFRLAGLLEDGWGAGENGSAARVTVEAPAPLVPLLRASHRVSAVVAEGDPLPAADCWAPLLSLPRLMGIGAETVPDRVPYLRADPSRLAPWRARLGEGLKIAIAWRGGEPLFDHRSRAVPLGAFAPLAALPGVTLVSVQKGPGRDEIRSAPFPVLDLTDEIDEGMGEGEGAFTDTAAILSVCALTVCADTAIAHLAGALARPCWTVLPEGGDWRFGWHAAESAWYPTLECIRRPPGGRWEDAMAHIARRLTALRDGPAAGLLSGGG
jgi:tetratricopeptide (TPR) repeat protein